MTTTTEPIEAAVRLAVDLVTNEGPLAVTDVLRRLAEAGFDIETDDLIDELVDAHHIWWLADYLLLEAQALSGRSFTHRLSQAEIDGDYIERGTDLHLLTLDEARVFASSIGELAEDFSSSEQRLGGPAGCMAAFAPGDVLSVAWRASGDLVIARADVVGEGTIEIDALRRAFAVAIGDSETTTLLDVLFLALQRDEEIFRNAPPLADLAVAAGMSISGDEVGAAGIDWDAVYGARQARYADDLAEQYDLDPRSAADLATLAVSVLWDEDSEREIDVAGCAEALRDPDATAAFLERKTDRDADSVGRLRVLVRRVEAEHSDCAGAALVSARCAELEGDAVGHANEVDRALRIDPAFWPAREDRAWVRSDAGNARGATDDVEFSGVEPPSGDAIFTFTRPGPTTARRNEPCPCGSGVKHKLCCGPYNGYPLALRAMWLYVKALWFAARPAQRLNVEEMLEEVIYSIEIATSDEDGFVDFTEFVDNFLDDPVVLDAVLSTSGMLRRFRDERGLLLPPDEAALLDQWMDAPSSLYRIEAWTSADQVELVDLVSNERMTAFAPAHDDTLSVGEVVACSLLSDGARPCLLGWSTVAPAYVEQVRAELADYDVLAVVRAHVEWRIKAALEAIGRVDPAMADMAAWLFPQASDDERAKLPIAELARIEYADAAAAADRGDDTIEIDGMPVHPKLHLALQTLVAEQILDNRPPEMWQAAIRLSSQGFDRNAILDMLTATVLPQAYAFATGKGVYDELEQIEMLAGLPESHERAREEHLVRKATGRTLS